MNIFSSNNKPPHFQAKLMIGQSNDRYEQEADRMAEQVMQMPEGGEAVQRQCKECEEERLQMKSFVESITPAIQRQEEEELFQVKADGSPANTASTSLESQLNSRKGQGQSLPEGTQQTMSRAFSSDFGEVKVHTDQTAVQMTRKLGARAFTHGADVYFNKGEYDPDSADGKRLLGHELTHVVQQGSSQLGIQKTDEEKENNDFAILIAYPDATATVNKEDKVLRAIFKDKKLNVHHAGVIIVDGDTGTTKYFDFGRFDERKNEFDRKSGYGVVRSSETVPSLEIKDLTIDSHGNITEASLRATLASLQRSKALIDHGYIRMVASLYKDLDYDKMLAYARELEYKGNIFFGGYVFSKGIEKNYCAKFAREVVRAGGGGFNIFTFKGGENVKSTSKKNDSQIYQIKKGKVETIQMKPLENDLINEKKLEQTHQIQRMSTGVSSRIIQKTDDKDPKRRQQIHKERIKLNQENDAKEQLLAEKKSYAEMKASTDPIVAGHTMADLEELIDRKNKKYGQAISTTIGVGKLILPEFHMILSDLSKLEFNNEDLSKTEKEKIQRYEQLNLTKGKEEEKHQELYSDLPDEYKVFTDVKAFMKKIFEEKFEDIQDTKIQELEKQKKKELLDQMESEDTVEKQLTEVQIHQIQDEITSEINTESLKSQILSEAKEQAAMQIARDSAPSLCNIISSYLFYRAIGKIPEDKSFAKWYVEEIKRGDINLGKSEKRKTTGINYGADWILGKEMEKDGAIRFKPFKKEEHLGLLNASGTKIAVVRNRKHFYITVKDKSGNWHNLDHTSTDFARHGGFTDWDQITSLLYNPNINDTLAKKIIQEINTDETKINK